MHGVLETTKTQINFFSQLKLKIFKILRPVVIKFNKFYPFFTIESFIIYYFFLVFLFGRSFTGIQIAGFRIGELMIGTAMMLFFYFLIFRSRSINLIIGKKANYVLRIILIHFFIVNFVNGGLSNFLNPEVFRSSSYIWSIGFFFVLYFIKKFRVFDSNLFLTGMFVALPLTYILTSVYYPSFLSDFFIQYSDKFRLLKGSDLFLVYAIYCLLFFDRIKNNNFIYIFTFVLSGTLLPLIVFSSRGASIGAMIIFIYSVFKNRKAFLRSKILFIGSLIAFFGTLTLSSIYLDWTKIDFEEINTEMALDSLEMTLVSKRYPETVKPYIYFENKRINSGDGNLNWRLQIWQDVYQDLNDKNKLIFGYGYAGSIPAMDRIDRAGLDGTNIHVHNYFVNMLARGGLIHVFLYLLFYLFLLGRIINYKDRNNTIAFIFAALFVSFFDSSMETVRFPFLFYTVLSYKLKQE
tara:strand:- start:3057 stop:4448 length:1392 start_codon:yes stop_codon:yes gene_type:complete